VTTPSTSEVGLDSQVKRRVPGTLLKGKNLMKSRTDEKKTECRNTCCMGARGVKEGKLVFKGSLLRVNYGLRVHSEGRRTEGDGK